MENRWKQIWDNKHFVDTDLTGNEFEVYCRLKKANGFDVDVADADKYYRFFYNGCIDMCEKLKKYAAKPIESICDVGCGSGVNLYMLSNRAGAGRTLKMYGIDYSAELVELAKRVVPEANIVCNEALAVDTSEKYDVVISDSVFQYFVSPEYGERVLEKMLGITGNVLYLGEIYDKDKEKAWLDHRRERQKNYDEMYKGLPKMFFSHDQMERIAKKYGRRVVFEETENPEYLNNDYIFNCYMF